MFFKNHAFQRVGKTNHRISANKIRELAKQERAKLHWDQNISQGATFKDIEQFGLNERQRKAIEFIKQYGKITLGEFKKFYPDAAERTLRKDLDDLVKLELIKAIGEKRGRKYTLR